MTDEIHIPPTPEEIASRLEALERLLELAEHGKPIASVEEPEPTRTNITKIHRSGETVVMEWDSIHSVEITNSVKEGWRVSKVKVYDPDPIAAARIGAHLAMEAERQLEREMDAKHAAIGQRADAANSEESDG